MPEGEEAIAEPIDGQLQLEGDGVDLDTTRESSEAAFAVLSRRQYEGFRSAEWSSQLGGVNQVKFDTPEAFSKVKPPFFPVPSCVVQGSRAAAPGKLPQAGLAWTGRVTTHHATWPDVEQELTYVDERVTAVTDDSAGSPYREAFSQGATLVPRVLIFAEKLDAGPLGVAAGRVQIRSVRSTLEKKPWKNVPSLEGMIETEYLHPVVTGGSIVSFRLRPGDSAIVPFVNGALIDGKSEALDEHPGLAAWWRDAERVWEKNKAKGSSLSLIERIDFQRGLSKQFPIQPLRVVYTTSGQYLAACVLDDPAVVVDSSLYWAPVSDLGEARYLTAVLNSDALAAAVTPMQARGEHNPRHFHLLPVTIPFPHYDATVALHRDLVKLATRAEDIASGIEIDPNRRFEVARRQVREALAEDGAAAGLSEAVTELLAPDAAPLS